MRVFLVDDEPLALRRLSRMLNAGKRVKIVGTESDPAQAVAAIQRERPDAVFLDIQMPEMSGFDVLARLDPQPLVVFTTAHDQFALQAFTVNSVDYLLKPIENAHLERALNKLERMLAGREARPDLSALIAQITAGLRGKEGESGDYLERLPSRIGERIELVELAQVTHLFARDKLTFAATPTRNYVVDLTIQELEQRLAPQQFVRIHRSTIVALKSVHELHPMFAGGMRILLKDAKRTELNVARDRVKVLKERLGLL
jgi:two-component system, LytTR family, response regulator